MAETPSDPKPGRRNVRVLLRTGAVVLVLLPALALLALPGALGSRPGRLWLLNRANRAMAPGGLGFESLEFSWFGPTEIKGFEIRDAKGDRVVAARRASWDRNFRQVLFERPELGTFRLERAVIDAERAADGTIDLYEALKPVIGLDPGTRLKIEVVDGRLSVRGAGLREPVEAEHADITVDVAPKPGPISWNARLANGDPKAPGDALTVVGRYEDASPNGKLDLKVVGRQWPFALGSGRLAVSARLDGSIAATSKHGRWDVAGDATLEQVEAAGTLLAGDRLKVDRVKGVWQVEAGKDDWAIRRFELSSPLATLQAVGASVGRTSFNIEGRIDLAALSAQIPHALKLKEGVVLEQGTATISLKTGSAGGTPEANLTAKVSDLRAREGDRTFVLRDPATLSALLRRPAESGVVEVERVSAVTPYLNAEARGDLSRGVELSGTIDLEGLQAQSGGLVDFGGVGLAGRGEFKGNYRADRGRYRGRLDAAVKGLKVSGVGPRSVDREAVDLWVELDGPSAASGLPVGWGGVRSRLTSGDLAAEWTGAAEGNRGSAVLTTVVDLAGRKAKAEARVGARWEETGATFDPLVVTLAPVGGETGLEPVSLSARGRYDRVAGELTLAAIPAERPGAVALGETGLKVTRLGDGPGWTAEGQLVGDLAALPAWVAQTGGGIHGRWAALATARSGEGGTEFGGRVGIVGLRRANAGSSAGEFVRGDVRGMIAAGGQKIELAELTLRSRYGSLEGSGTIDDLGGKRLANLSGRLSPEWKEITGWLAANVEPGARVSGRPRPWTLRCELREGGRETLVGEAGVELVGADVYGLKLGQTAVVVRGRGGRVVIDPIDGTLNEGRVHLEPSFRDRDANGPAAVVLGEGSALTDVRVNDEVSRRVLSFVAPVLDNATRVRGRISAAIDNAVFPLGETRTGPTVEGEVVFQNLSFLPGALVNDLFSLINQQDRPLLTLNGPVSLAIADRRVDQRGLVVPIGRLSKIEFDGSVGFDRDLDVVASIPILPTMLAGRPILGAIAADARIRVPIRGTLQQPEVDKGAFKAGMNDLGRSLLGRSVVGGAAGLIERLTRPGNPNAPPPPTFEERRARRQGRQLDRQPRRGQVNPQ